MYNQQNAPSMTVTQLIAALTALDSPDAYVRLEAPNGWRNPLPVVVAGHNFQFTEGNLVTL